MATCSRFCKGWDQRFPNCGRLYILYICIVSFVASWLSFTNLRFRMLHSSIFTGFIPIQHSQNWWDCAYRLALILCWCVENHWCSTIPTESSWIEGWLLYNMYKHEHSFHTSCKQYCCNSDDVFAKDNTKVLEHVSCWKFVNCFISQVNADTRDQHVRDSVAF